MGLFDREDKAEMLIRLGQLEAKVEMLQLQAEELRREKGLLNDQIRSLQDALVAVKAPESYRALMDDRNIKEWDGQGFKPSNDEESRAYRMMTQAMESTYIRSADDLFSLLPKEVSLPAPLHDEER